ncbi:hypothetical protein OG252_13185 [Streptomyces sp. NBC_01352]|uniref:hypothetical protein n=1 Tax=Streptomyces sp. NBC_01352 TaxID=2903834 RepID=UPI002E345A6F|nr:hypothetical protein [Streptomyces sp. NBC_01352]
MKIVKRVGERLLPDWIRAELRPILAFTGTGNALWAGSRVLAGRIWGELGEHFDRWERLAALAGAGYVAGYGCWHAPHIAEFAVPGAVLGWCVAAWWMTPPVFEPVDEETWASAPTDDFAQWLIDLIGNRPGIHLRDLYPAMRELPGHEDRDNGQLRAALNHLGIPVRRSLRIGLVAGRSGVALADLQPLPSPLGESGGDFDGDAGQIADSPVGELAGERLESP